MEVAAASPIIRLSLPTKTVSIASAATSPPTLARPCPFAIGPRTRRNSHSRSSSSPGSTIRLKRQSSIPAKKGTLPRFASSASTATAPHCAIASMVSTPGITGRPGKCPGNHHPSSGTRKRPRTLRPGSSSSTSSTSRNGGRWGMIDSIVSRPNGVARSVMRRRAARAAREAGCGRGARGTWPSRPACRLRPRSPRTCSRARP